MKKLVLLALLALGFSPLHAQVSKKGDVIFGAGWGYNAAKNDTADRVDGLVASVEGFISQKISLRADYFRVQIAVEEQRVALVPWVSSVVETYVATSESKGLSLCASPHVHALSFPIGLLAVDVPDRNAPAWGGTAGAAIDFWADKHLGLGFTGSYQYLRNTVLNQDFWNASGQIKLRF